MGQRKSTLLSQTSNKTRSEVTVHGYIRENFDKKYWIDEIIAKVTQFYMINGGSLYVCGDGEYGQLGTGKHKNKTCQTPTLCPPFIDNNAYKVSAGSDHTLIIDTKGDVWCCGRGGNGRLGTGKTKNMYVPKKLNLGIRVIAISAGRIHSLLLCENGTVKGCGDTGVFDFDDSLVPKTIEKLKKYKVIQISAGGAHSAALTEGGVLFCFGCNRHGQCGVGKEKGKKIKTPTKVDLDDEIEFVDCGSYHTLVITRKGLLYSFGDCAGGMLGHGNKDKKYVPTLIESSNDKRMRMCAGGIAHSLCIDEEGIIWSFGSNYYGQCGFSKHIEEQTTPKMIEWFIKNEIKAKECFAGGAQSSVIAHNGSLYLFGKNNVDQLGLNEDRYYLTPTELSISQDMTVQSVSMGSAHIAIICNSQ